MCRHKTLRMPLDGLKGQVWVEGLGRSGAGALRGGRPRDSRGGLVSSRVCLRSRARTADKMCARRWVAAVGQGAGGR